MIAIEFRTYVLNNGVVHMQNDNDFQVHRIKPIIDSFMLMCSDNNFLIDNIDLTYRKLMARRVYIEEDLMQATGEDIELLMEIESSTSININMYIPKVQHPKARYTMQFQQVSNWKGEGF